MKENNTQDRSQKIDRAIILIALIVFFTSTLLLFKDDYSFENPLTGDSRKMGNIVNGKGDIRWKRYDRLQWETAEAATDLFMKDQIFVGKNSNLEIVLDGVKIKLQQNTLISIRKNKGSIDLQIMYGKVTLDKPPTAKKIVMRNQHNQTVWKSDESQSIKTVDVTNDTVMYKTDNLAELQKVYWVSTPAVAETNLDPMPEPPAPYVPPPPPIVYGQKMAQFEPPQYRELEKIEKRKDLIAQNMTAKPESVFSLEKLKAPLRKIFAIWSVNAFGMIRSPIVDNSTATVGAPGTWGPGLNVEYRRRFSSWTMNIPFMWVPSAANINSKMQLLHVARTGVDYEHPGSFVNYIGGMRFNYENYITVTPDFTPVIQSYSAVPLILGVSKQMVFANSIKARGTLNWCPTYVLGAGSANFVCMNSALAAHWMSTWGFNMGSQLFVNYYNLDLKTDKLRATEVGVGFGAEF